MNIAKITVRVLAAALTGLLSAACSVGDSDDAMGPPDGGNVSLGIGNVTGVNAEDGTFFIYTDEGEVFRVVENLAPEFELYSGRRILFSYNTLDRIPTLPGKPRAYEVRINSFSDMITGVPLRSSGMGEATDEFLGSDGIYVNRSWFGGEYINIEYGIFAGSGPEHGISLVWDDSGEYGDSIVLFLKHNAYGEVPGERTDLTLVSGICSFRISGLLAGGTREAVVTLYWDSYTDDFSSLVTNHSTGTFVPLYPPEVPEPG